MIQHAVHTYIHTYIHTSSESSQDDNAASSAHAPEAAAPEDNEAGADPREDRFQVCVCVCGHACVVCMLVYMTSSRVNW